MTIEITEKKLKAAIQIAFAECFLEDENLENLIIIYTKELSVFGVKQLSDNEDIGEAFEEEFGCRSDYFNHRVGLFNDMKNWVVEKYKSKKWK